MKTISDTIGRATTDQFINENPSIVVLSRPAWIETTAGGRKKGAPTDVAPQTMRLITLSSAPERITEDGSIVVPTTALIGQLDADVQRFDEALIDEIPYRIVWVIRRPLHFRTVAEVVQYAT